MKRLLIGAALCGLFAAPGLAGEPAKVTTEPVKLTLSQMDQVAAGNPCSFAFKSVAVCANVNLTKQNAKATAIGVANVAAAANSNTTLQNISGP